MHALFEDDGSLKAGTIHSETDATAQIELSSGRRVKVKTNAVLLRFAAPAAEELLKQAEAHAESIDLELLWETLSDADLTFQTIAHEYFGAGATSVQQATALVQLLAHPMYFRKRGKGLFKRAPEAELKAALAGVERKKQEAAQLQIWADALIAGQLPEAFGTPPNATIDRLLYAPDKNASVTKALALASEGAKKNPVDILRACGAIASTHDFHFRRFLFHTFPKGIAFPELSAQPVADLPQAPVRAFSIDDAETTEIDDAFSVTYDVQGNTIIGIHIAAPALGISPDSPADMLARDRLSTVYMPGNKITMLPPAFVEQFTLAEGRTVPALSLYATINEAGDLLTTRTALERVPIAANLRLQHLDDTIVDPLATERKPWHDEMVALHRFAKARFVTRGKNEINRIDYNFYVDTDAVEPTNFEKARVRIEARERGSAIDLIVSELMIFANATWGQALADKGFAGMFRVQGAGKTKMSIHPGPHEGLGVKVYLWSTSPLRRYSDLINQRQLIALAQEAAPPYTKQSATLMGAVADFDATYNQYGDFQDQMETYWCCRWLLQEGATELNATVIRENLVRFGRLPMVRRLDDLPFSAPGTEVKVKVNDVNLFDATLSLSVVAP
jgi:exoribonuclease II